MHRLLIVPSIAVMTLSGCAFFTRPMEKPVIEDSLRQGVMGEAAVGVLSLTPERRVVIHRFDNNRFCAENPTEVGIELASATKFLANASLPDQTKAEIGFAMAAASNNNVLNRRTQGMQLYQASAYSLCQMYMNKAIDEASYRDQHLQLFRRAAELIDAELKVTVETKTVVHPPGTAASGVTQMLGTLEKSVTLTPPSAKDPLKPQAVEPGKAPQK